MADEESQGKKQSPLLFSDSGSESPLLFGSDSAENVSTSDSQQKKARKRCHSPEPVEEPLTQADPARRPAKRPKKEKGMNVDVATAVNAAGKVVAVGAFAGVSPEPFPELGIEWVRRVSKEVRDLLHAADAGGAGGISPEPRQISGGDRSPGMPLSP